MVKLLGARKFLLSLDPEFLDTMTVSHLYRRPKERSVAPMLHPVS